MVIVFVETVEFYYFRTPMTQMSYSIIFIPYEVTANPNIHTQIQKKYKWFFSTKNHNKRNVKSSQ